MKNPGCESMIMLFVLFVLNVPASGERGHIFSYLTGVTFLPVKHLPQCSGKVPGFGKLTIVHWNMTERATSACFVDFNQTRYCTI